MYVAPVISAEEEAALLKEWFETVHFDVESEGIPELDPERDDEGRSESVTEQEIRQSKVDLSTVEFDDLMSELRVRDPNNPF